MKKLTNKEAWLQLFQENDVALIAAIGLCQRFGPSEPELNEAQHEYIAKMKKWLTETADESFCSILTHPTDLISVHEYNTVHYPQINKASSFVRCLDHALEKSDDNAKMQCRVIGWDNETKRILTDALNMYQANIKSKIDA